MATKPCMIYLFLSAVQGNWRNAVYVDCGTSCRRVCDGFLLAFDHDGKAALLPADFIQRLTGQAADKSECAAVFTREQFESIFALYTAWLTEANSECPALTFMRQCEYQGRACLFS